MIIKPGNVKHLKQKFEDTYQNDETHELNWLATDDVNSGNSEPVAWYSTSQNDDQVTDSSVHEHLVDSGATREANSLENDGAVQRDTIIRTRKVRMCQYW